jgi:hypothetical protein
MEMLKNPYVIGLLCAALTLLYIWWTEKKRMERNPKAKPQQLNFVTPVVVGGISWFIASNYLKNSVEQTVDQGVELLKNNVQQNLSKIVGGTGPSISKTLNPTSGTAQIPTNNIDTIGSSNYRLLSKRNIRLPPTDVFIDLAKF